jgi:hypothetical protein
MGTDATAILEILNEPALAALPTSIAYRVTYAWAEVSLARDYELFDLLAGGRSGDRADAVVPVRPVRWQRATEDDPDSSWVTTSELERVAEAYRAQTGRESAQARALVGMMRGLGQEGDVRLLVRFF